MKKIFLILVAFLFSTTSLYAYQCDQTFYGKLRYGYQYNFYDSFSNNSSNSIGINKVDVNYTEQFDYNGSSLFPSFDWTNWFKNKGYILNPGESGKVIKASTNYPINYIPTTRSTNNFVIQYVAKYYEKQGGNWDMNNPKYHRECKYYEITWCGDGVVDSSYGEQCDPNDSSKSGWGNGGCDASCKPVNTPVTPSCDSLEVNPDSGNAPLTSALYCLGSNVSSYKINILKDGVLLDTINGNSGNYTFNSVGTYVVNCYVNNNVTSNSCKKTINITETTPTCGNGIVETGEQCDDGNTVDGDGCSSTCTTETTPTCGNGIVETGEQCDDGNTVDGDGCSSTCTTEGGGGGGRSATCYDIETSGTQVTCYGNDMTETFRVDCGNGTNKFVMAVDTNDGSLKTKGTVTCDYSVNPKVSEPRCYVSSLGINVIPNPKENYSGWITRNQCKATVGQTCGNGILEGNEECERDSSGNWPSICNTNCTLKNPGGVTTTPDEVPGVITIPNHGNIIFGEKANIIIYKGQSVADKVSTPYIYNDSDYDLNLKGLCVVQTSGNTLTRPSIQPNCKALPGILYPGQKIEFPGAYDDYKGKEITTGNYGDNILKITYQKLDGTILDWAYFAETVKVRVAKPSIITTGGGTSYVRSTNKVSDINKVADGVVDSTKVDDNKNFVGTSVSDLTSYSDNTTNTNIVDKVEDTGNDYNSNLDGAVDNSTPATTEIKTSLLDFESYNGMNDVYVLKSKNFKINSDLFSSVSGPRTYIIENGDLYINKDIVYNDNIAFVVKGGDIIIDSTVKRIDGTYITLKQGTNGGNIKSAQSTETLVVNGSLYGNIDDLVSNRVKVEENNGNLSVGTIVSFGSSLFRKPAPLVSEFIAEYLNQQKVAK